MNSELTESQQTLEWWKNMALALHDESVKCGDEIERLEQALAKAEKHIDELENVMLDFGEAT